MKKTKLKDLEDVQRDCLFCGIRFTPKRVNQLYCCKQHRNRVYQPVQAFCSFCYKEFRKERVNQDFCSKNCGRLHHLKNFERPKIPKSVFVGSREQIVSNLENWLDENGYFKGD
jgi:hypothetical protein